MEENPYQSPEFDGEQPLFDAALGDGERVLFEIAARSPSRRGWLFGMPSMVIGKFMVTNRRVMFLSSGTNGDLHFGVTDRTIVRRIAASVDFASMSGESSWEFELSKLRFADGSYWRELKRRLQLTGIDRSGLVVSRNVYPYGVRRRTWRELVAFVRHVTSARSPAAP